MVDSTIHFMLPSNRVRGDKTLYFMQSVIVHLIHHIPKKMQAETFTSKKRVNNCEIYFKWQLG